jgi:hypothetical protein
MYCRQRRITCYAVSFDQAKAFDRVDHKYFFKILEVMGFGPDFIKWVKLLYTKISSQVLVNGFLTAAFSVSHSIRQGCGLSPLLYALCIQPLAANISANLLFKGIPMPALGAPPAKIRMYADDTTVFAGDIQNPLN